MAEDWATAAADIAAGIKDVGSQEMILRSSSAGPAFNPVNRPDVQASCSVMRDKWTREQIASTLIESGDVKFLMAASGFTIAADDKGRHLNTPAPGDRLKTSTEEFDIVGIETIAPGGVPLMWELQCRA